MYYSIFLFLYNLRLQERIYYGCKKIIICNNNIFSKTDFEFCYTLYSLSKNIRRSIFQVSMKLTEKTFPLFDKRLIFEKLKNSNQQFANQQK